jgi:HEAT repeat protein
MNARINARSVNARSRLLALSVGGLSVLAVLGWPESARSQNPPPPDPLARPQPAAESLERQVLRRLLPGRVPRPPAVALPVLAPPILGPRIPDPPQLSLDAAIAALQAVAPAQYPTRKSGSVQGAPLSPGNVETRNQYNAAVSQLVRLGESAVPAMVGFLQGSDAALRSAAEDVLGQLRSPRQSTLDSLILALGHADADVRFRVASVLGTIAPETALRPLLRDGNPWVRAGAAQALGEQVRPAESAIPDLQRLLQDDNLFVRGYAAWAIGHMGWRGGVVESALPDLQRLLRDVDGDVRAIARGAIDQIQNPILIEGPSPPPMPKVQIQGPLPPIPVNLDQQIQQQIQNLRNPSNFSAEDTAIAQLSQVSPSIALPKLLPLLQDPDEGVRSRGARVIGKAMGEPAIPAVLPLLQHPNPAIQSTAIYTLRSMGQPGVMPLIPLLKNSALRPQIILSFGYGADVSDWTIPALTPFLRDPDPRMRAMTAATIGKLYQYRPQITTKPPIAALTPLLRDPQVLVRWRAINALGEMATAAEAALPALIPLLDDPSPLIQSEASRAIAFIGPAAIPLLAAQLQHPDANVRWRAVKAISSWQTWPAAIADRVAPALLTLLDEPNPDLRRQAIYALGGAKSAAHPMVSNQIVPKLVPLLRDSQLNGAALWTLGQMGAKAARAVPELMALLRADPVYSPDGIAETLGLIGPAAKAALPELNRLLQRASTFPYARERVQKTAQWAMDQIRQVPGRATARPSLDYRQPAAFVFDRGADVASLLGVWPDHDPWVRRAVRDQLRWGDYQPDSLRPALPELLPLMQHADLSTRVTVAVLLGKIGEPAKAAIPEMVALLNNPALEAPDLADVVTALGGMGPSAAEAVPSLIPLLRSPVRSRAAQALGNIGAAAKPAIPHMLPLLKDADVIVRSVAMEALRKLGHPP